MPCREHLAQLRGRQEELDQLGAAVIAVSFEPPKQVARFVKHTRIAYPVYSDPERLAYAAFGLGRAPASKVWNWDTIRSYVRNLREGRTPHMPRGDLAQMGGDFVIDATGTVVLAHPSRFPADRPGVEEILEAVRGMKHDA